MRIKFTFISICLLAATSTSLAETNYVALQNKCQGNTNPGCCISSVRAMRDGKFQQAMDGKCPDGFTAQMFRCEGSLSWCEPKEEADIAVNGGGIGNYKKEAQETKKEKDKVAVEEEKAKEEELAKKKK